MKHHLWWFVPGALIIAVWWGAFRYSGLQTLCYVSLGVNGLLTIWLTHKIKQREAFGAALQSITDHEYEIEANKQARTGKDSVILKLAGNAITYGYTLDENYLPKNR